MEQVANHDNLEHDLKHKLWLNSWWFSFVILAIAFLYELIYEKSFGVQSLADICAMTGAILIAASFCLSGFSYYFNFLDSKLGYRKYLGVVGFLYALGYSLMLIFIYPDKYGAGLMYHLNEAEVILGLAAMAIFVFMIVISNIKTINKFLGPKHWRQGLRLGYLAMIFLAIRAYLVNGQVWVDWLDKIDSLPPPSLVMAAIVFAVIILRISMMISLSMASKIVADKNVVNVEIHNNGNIRLILIITIVVVSGLLFFSYRYLTLRPVLAPTELSRPIVDSSEELSEEAATESMEIKLQTDASLSFLKLPPGFAIQIFAEGLSPSVLSKPGPGVGPRLMTLVGDAVFVALPGRGEILAIKDTDNNGRADWQQVFISGLKRPHNLAYHEDWYYIAAEDGIYRVKDTDRNFQADESSPEKIVSLPVGGHWTRTVKVINNELYISVGSSCNVCHETDSYRAAITKCDLDGKNCVAYAQGLRNTVDFVEYDGQIYGTDNGRDQLGNLIPPEEVNLIIKGGNYGWPVCYGQKIHDNNFDKNVYIRDPCTDTIAPLVELPAHNAPLGLAFYEGTAWPSEYQGDLFVASHGSWNRQPPDGYKIFRIDWQTKKVSDFITGWLDTATVRGRPVGILNYQNGLLISDDAAGIIYLVRYSS